MLISRVLEGEERDESTQKKTDVEDGSHDYQTASELFKIMSKEQSFDANDDNSLTPEDLVVLYKNIDKGAKLITNADKFTRQRPNQYVETIVYNDDADSDGSEISDVNSVEELQKVISLNKERINSLNSHLSLENKVCQKLGGVDIQSSKFTSEYNKYFLFKDPYIKDQLNSLNVGFSQLEGSVLPASLLDYICCKRLEDNYNFYMDNIITYVKHTIEQLKRISNGEYLTDRTKERWKEVDNKGINKSTKILATSTSIPLHVESKSNGQASTWNDLVHSEVDVRYLSKIIEKQISIEVPKLICGSYKLFSKRCADNLIISCKKGNQRSIKNDREEKNVSRVDLVFQLQESQSGHMMGNINSIMIIQTPPNMIDNSVEALLPLSYKQIDNNENIDKTVKITEVSKDEETNPNTAGSTNSDATESKDIYFGDYETQCDSVVGTNDYPNSDNDYNISKNQSCSELSESTEFFRNSLSNEPLMQKESFNHVASSDKLRLSMEMYLPKEDSKDVSLWTNPASKKKSPTRTRIKSPYENRSHILEEKKRKRLLEIRDRRERKKLVLAEGCKVIKQKYPKGFAIPQPSSSVTKLSITNKSFYNSIYGQAINIENKQGKAKNHVGVKKDSIPEVPIDEIGPEGESLSLTREENSEKYINRSYYLDNAITEVMYTEMNKKDNCEARGHSTSTSADSSDFPGNVNLLSEITGQSVPDLHKEVVMSDNTFTLNDTSISDEEDDIQTIDNVHMPSSVENIVPANSPTNVLSDSKSGLKKATLTLECKKSIDKIYNLMKRLKNVNDEKIPLKNKSLLPMDSTEARGSLSIQGSDSGTSIKHHLTSSNPSYFSFEKHNEIKSKIPTVKKSQTPIVPKVIISNKFQSMRPDMDKLKKNKKPLLNTPSVGEDPLKAISQLLHNIDNVQKTRHKATESIGIRKSELAPSDVKTSSRQGSVKRRSRFDQHLKDSQFPEKNAAIMASRKPKSIFDITKLHQHSLTEKQKRNERLIVDIIDEAKEARGEAVRGPPKLYSRLNSLAQPKKAYVQAHSEEYHSKYGKNLMADRLQKLAKTTQNSVEPKVGSANSRIKQKKAETRAVSPMSAKPTPVPTIVTSMPQSASISPKEKSASPKPQSKYNNIPKTVERLKNTVNMEKRRYVPMTLLSGPDVVPPKEHISLVPLLPNDIDLKSDTSTEVAEESSELGNKLHYTVDTMLNPKTSSTLAVLSESFEINSKIENIEEYFLADGMSKKEQIVLKELDFPVDAFEDKNIITLVANEGNKEIKRSNKNLMKHIQPEIGNLTTELANIENVLCTENPVGNFQEEIRIKNLTLTPEQSAKSHFLLKRGDTVSALLNVSTSQNFNKSDHGKLSDIKTYPLLSKSDLDWSFIKFPMQIATIGYAFPNYSLIKFESHSKLKTLTQDIKENSKPANINVVKNSTRYSQTTKCLGTDESKVNTEHAVQIDATDNNWIVKPNPKDNILKEIKTANVDDVINPTVDDLLLVGNGKTNSSNELNDVSSVDYTTSLDMLVSLLNEIQKITACQTHISSTDNSEQECKRFETITKETAALEKYSKDIPRKMASIISLDKLRQLKSSSSIYSIYLSTEEKQDFCKNGPKNTFICRPICADKEVYANLHTREKVNRFTEVPSLFPITINHSTNVSNTLIGVLSEPSSQSLFSSYVEYKSTYSANSIKPQKEIIELPDKSSRQSLVLYEKTIDLKALAHSDVTQKNQQTKLDIRLQNCLGYKNDHNHDSNASIQMKRDILVTVYSILVFTVFAALSFPGVIYSV